jgi:Protein of unknown function (DUF3667)
VNCLNCGADLQGAFCHDCGQKAAAHHLGLHAVAHDAVHEFLHLDGKILQTMKLLLFKPGQLTKDFIEGKRVRYISPIRLYLTWSVVFFALAVLVPGARESIVKVGPSKNATAAETIRSEEQADKIGESLMHQLPRAMFILMPLFGLLTWAFYRKQQPYYIPHLYFAIHFHAFIFFMLALGVLVGAIGRSGKLAGALMFVTAVPYHFIALRRVFGGSRAATLWKGFATGFLYVFAVGAVMFGVALMVMRSMTPP